VDIKIRHQIGMIAMAIAAIAILLLIASAFTGGIGSH